MESSFICSAQSVHHATKQSTNIDDELQSRNFLCKMLQKYFPDISLVGEASTVEEAINGIKKHNPNIVFLDIQMKDETGFDLLNRLPEINFALIFTTAFDQYAIKAFRFSAIDYLLKPIVTDEFIESKKKIIIALLRA